MTYDIVMASGATSLRGGDDTFIGDIPNCLTCLMIRIPARSWKVQPHGVLVNRKIAQGVA